MSMMTNDEGVRLTEIPKVYDDGRTKQSFKDSADINKILKRAQKEGTISHLQKYPEAVYGEFEGIDLLEAHGRIARAQAIFDDLPSEIRSEFDNDALRFAGYASNPENRGRLSELLPQLAEPGRTMPNPVQRGGQGAAAATAAEPPSDPVVEEPPAAPPAAEAPPASTPT